MPNKYMCGSDPTNGIPWKYTLALVSQATLVNMLVGAWSPYLNVDEVNVHQLLPTFACPAPKAWRIVITLGVPPTLFFKELGLRTCAGLLNNKNKNKFSD